MLNNEHIGARGMRMACKLHIILITKLYLPGVVLGVALKHLILRQIWGFQCFLSSGVLAMKRYIVANQNGETFGHEQLKEGKTVHSAKVGCDEPIVRIILSGFDTPLLAALEYPGSCNEGGCRLFMLQTWKVEGDGSNPQACTMVNEEGTAPEVSMEQKLVFFLNVALQLYKNRDFKKWAKAWLSGEDRSAESALSTYEEMEKEKEAEAALGDLAAWGVSSVSDSDEMEKHEAAETLAFDASRLVALVTTEPDSKNISKLIDRIGREIKKQSNKVDLPKLAEAILG